MKAINFTEEDRYMLVLSTGAILMTPKELFQIYGEKNYKEIDESLTVIGDCCQVDLGEGIADETGKYIENVAVIVRVK